MELAHAYTDLADAGEHDAVPRAQALILGLGFKVGELDEPVNSFSGGWRMRLQLARALMCPSDLLLLDEPTNHLDLDALVWLEAWLQKYAGTMIVISHDREFLDAVTNVTLHIANAQLTRYGGNYSKFEDPARRADGAAAASLSKQQDKIAHLQKFIDRFKAKASKAKQAQSRVKALERMERDGAAAGRRRIHLRIQGARQPAQPDAVHHRRPAFGYAPTEDDTRRRSSQGHPDRREPLGAGRPAHRHSGRQRPGQVHAGQDHCPRNGALAGTVTEGKGLNIGYFAQQELDVLHPESNPLEHMIRMARDLGSAVKESTSEQSLRGFLGSFNFSGDMVKQPVGTMSGGEKARLVLAMMVWQRPNLLLLDEPTNHLDLATREALAVALNEFEGTLMLVSHDRALLRSVCDEFWLVGRGVVKDFDGDLDDYQRYLLDEAKRQREEAKESAQKPSAPAPALAAASVATPTATKQDAEARQQRANRLKPLKRELEAAETSLAQLNTEKSALEARMSTPLPAADIADCGKRLKALADELQSLEERWLALSDELEAVAG
jgi:ATP-binding cassette subfamily F protein 3